MRVEEEAQKSRIEVETLQQQLAALVESFRRSVVVSW
jgi:hypothetical protein